MSNTIKLSAANSPTVKLGDSDMIRVDKQIKNLNDSVAELENSKVDKADGKGLSSNDFTNADKNKLDSLENYDDTNLQETVEELDSVKEDKSNKITQESMGGAPLYLPDAANVTDDQYPSAKYVQNSLNLVNGMAMQAHSIAMGANKAKVFDDYTSFCQWVIDEGSGIVIAVNESEGMNIGNNIMIKTLNVPDLWFYGVHSEEYIETIPTDKEILAALKTNGYFDVGYGRFAALKTQKADLSEYYNKTEVDNKVNNKSEKTTITTATDTTASVTLINNTETRYNEITSLTAAFPESLTDGYISSIVFTSGSTVSTITIPNNVYMQGTDCSDGVFTPTANKRYTVIFNYDGEILSGIVNGIPKAVSE